MTALSSLQLVNSKKSLKASPIVHRRNKLVAKIHEQLELCEAKMNGQLYAPKKLRTYPMMIFTAEEQLKIHLGLA